MSDFLQFVDRIPTLPNRKKLTFENDGSVKYATVEYADEPAEEGTFLNKSNFNKLNSILGYNEIIGQYNPITENVEYNVPFNFNNIINNYRLLVQPTNSAKAPATDFNVIKNKTSINDGYNKPKSLEMSNGNIMVAGYANNNYYGYITILDKQGNVLKNKTSLGTYFTEIQMLNMTNNNIMIIGSNGNLTASYVTILDNLGNIIKSSTLLANYGASNLIEMSNGNILITLFSNSSYAGYFMILDKQGNVIKAVTGLGNYYFASKILEMSNGNIMIAGYYPSNHYGYYSIINKNGDIIVSSTPFISNNAFYEINIEEMIDGNIMVVAHGWGNVLYVALLDQNGSFIKQPTSSNISCYAPNMIKMSNNNVMVICESTLTILDKSGNVINTTTIDHLERPNLLEMSNGNILTFGTSGHNSYFLYISIVDKQGNNVKAIETYGNGFDFPYIKEMSNGNLFIVGTDNSYGNIEILEPISNASNVTINNIQVDTSLGKDKYYELVYNETQNKFIAEEVRQ